MLSELQALLLGMCRQLCKSMHGKQVYSDMHRFECRFTNSSRMEFRLGCRMTNLWEVLVLGAEVDLDHQVKVAQVIV